MADSINALGALYDVQRPSCQQLVPYRIAQLIDQEAIGCLACGKAINLEHYQSALRTRVEELGQIKHLKGPKVF